MEEEEEEEQEEEEEEKKEEDEFYERDRQRTIEEEIYNFGGIRGGGGVHPSSQQNEWRSSALVTEMIVFLQNVQDEARASKDEEEHGGKNTHSSSVDVLEPFRLC